METLCFLSLGKIISKSKGVGASKFPFNRYNLSTHYSLITVLIFQEIQKIPSFMNKICLLRGLVILRWCVKRYDK